MKANDIFELAERIAKLKTPEKPVPNQGRRRRPRNFKHFQNMNDATVAELLQLKWNELDALTKVVEDRQKAGKKEDKPKMNVFQTAVLLMAGYPIIAAIGFLFWWLK